MDKMREKLPIASNKEEFHVLRGLSNNGRQARTIKEKDVSPEEFEMVWKSHLRGGKLHVSQIQPQFEEELHDLIFRVYQKGLKNLEVRTLFARAFAWSHTVRAQSAPDAYKVDWTEFAAESLKCSNDNNKRRHGPTVDSFEGNISLITCEMKHLFIERTETEHTLREKEQELLRIEGSLVGSDKVLGSLAAMAEEKKKDYLELEATFTGDCDFSDAISALKMEERCIYDAMQKIREHLSGDKNMSIKSDIFFLKDKLHEINDFMSYWSRKNKHIASLQQLNKAGKRMIPTMSNYKMPEGMQKACEACGLAFRQDYQFLVSLSCNHAYHVCCFLTVAHNMQCMVDACKTPIPSALLHELGLCCQETGGESDDDSCMEEEEESLLKQAEDSAKSATFERNIIPKGRGPKVPSRVTLATIRSQSSKRVKNTLDVEHKDTTHMPSQSDFVHLPSTDSFPSKLDDTMSKNEKASCSAVFGSTAPVFGPTCKDITTKACLDDDEVCLEDYLTLDDWLRKKKTCR